MSTPRFRKETLAEYPPEHRSEETAHVLDIGDVDGDGRPDVVTAQRSGQLSWFRNSTEGWDYHTIDEVTAVSAGGTLYDVTGTGTLDLVLGSDYQNSVVYWWENPGAVDGEWTRRTIVDTGENKFHDSLVADVTGDGRQSLVFTNQCMGASGTTDIYRVPIPADPAASPWPDLERIASGNTVRNPATGSDNAEEGLAVGDIDGDGDPELVSGTRWYEHESSGWLEHRFAEEYTMTKVAIADIDGDGSDEIVLAEGDALIRGKDEGGKVGWFDPDDDPREPWTEHRIDDGLYDPHTLQVVDVTETAYPDLVVGEVGRTDENEEYTARLPRINLYENHGDGTFTTHFIDQGTGIHDGRWIDLDGDGTEELVGKPVRAHQHHQIHSYRQVDDSPERHEVS